MSNPLQRLAGLAGTLALAACGWGGSEPPDAHLVPDEVGFYAIDDDELTMRLDGPQQWEIETWSERQRLGGDAHFVIYDPTLSAGRPQAVRLTRVGWVRSEIDENGAILPARDGRWEPSDDQSADVPVQLTRVAARPDVVRLTPLQPLTPGLYSLQAQTAGGLKRARFGVGWPQVDKRTYAAANCLDRHLGAASALRPCTEQTAALMAKGLELHLVKPQPTQVDGGTALIVRGVVVNRTDRPKPLPMMEAQLRGADASVLKRWQFATNESEVAPRGSVPFETVVAAPPAGVRDVHIRLLPMTTLREARR